MAQAQFRRPGTHWFVGDGFIWDDWPADCWTAPGRPHECASKLLIFNPGRRIARVAIRFFHVDRPPTSVKRGVMRMPFRPISPLRRNA